MMNELKDYERAVYTFQAARGRYPGDVKNYGTFGEYSNYYSNSGSARPYYAYKASDFPSEFITEFQKTAGTNVVPNYYSAPFVELYNEGIIDFRPLGNNSSSGGMPSLKNYPKSYIYFSYTGTYSAFLEKPCAKGEEGCYFRNGLAYEGQIRETLRLYSSDYFSSKLLKAVDEKMDDGWYSTGIFRGGCYGSYSYGYNSYDNAIELRKNCPYFRYAI